MAVGFRLPGRRKGGPIDIKGGLVGKENLTPDKEIDDPEAVKRTQILELQQAKDAQKGGVDGEIARFDGVGLTGELGETVGKQAFNTNIVLINETVVSMLLKELYKLFVNQADGNQKQKDAAAMKRIYEIVSPDLIPREVPVTYNEDLVKTYVQLEGTLGSSLLNLDAFFETSEDPEVKGILEKHKMKRVVNLVYVQAKDRSRVFTPIKSTTDFWLQAYTDFYELDKVEWVLKPAVVDDKVPLPPELDLDLENQPYYKEAQNMIDAFGRASTKRLRRLKVRGLVVMPNAILEVDVEVINESGEEVDLRELAALHPHDFTSGPRLVLKDTLVHIDRKGNVEVVNLNVPTPKGYTSVEMPRSFMRALKPIGIKPLEVAVQRLRGSQDVEGLLKNASVSFALQSAVGQALAVLPFMGRGDGTLEDLRRNAVFFADASLVSYTGAVEHLDRAVVVAGDKGARYEEDAPSLVMGSLYHGGDKKPVQSLNLLGKLEERVAKLTASEIRILWYLGVNVENSKGLTTDHAKDHHPSSVRKRA